MMLAAIHLIPPCFAAPPNDWEVMRVFIADDPEQLNWLLTPYYTPVLIETLQQELKQESDLRKESLLASTVLQEAIYVARVDGDFIVSEQSRWKFSGKNASQPFVVGNVSLALRSARGLLPDKPQLVDYAQFTPKGSIELLPRGDNEEQWFGFSLNASRKSPQRRFDFQLPAASFAKLLIAAPASAEVSSNKVVVEKVQSLTSHLPADWGVGSSASAGTGSQWWLVHLSGVSNFDLNISRQSLSNLSPYKHIVQSSALEYSVSEDSLSTRARFQISNQGPPEPLRVRLGRELRIKDVLMNGMPAEWRAKPSLSGDSHLIELSSYGPTDEVNLLEVIATGATDTNQPVRLPEIAVAESYTVDGETRVFGVDGLVTDSIDVTGCVVRRLPLNTRLSPPHQAETLVWQLDWLGNPPRVQANFSQERRQWLVRTLTRFTVQSEWLSANCHIQIDSSQVDSNELRLRVGRNWFVDDVRLVQASGDVRARLEEREDADNPFIVIGWEGKRDELSLELEVIAHSPRDTTGETIGLRSPRLVTLPTADQVDNYVIESSNRFSVQLNSSLLRFQLQPVDLPEWQQRLLPPSTDKWIFQGVRGSIPPITLSATGGTYSARIATVVRNQQGRLNAEFRLQCVPISGSIDRLSLRMPKGLSSESLLWKVVQEDEGSELPVVLVQHDMGGAEDESLTELELAVPTSSPFTVRAQLPLETTPQGIASIPIPTVPAATSGESIVLFPRSFAYPVDPVSLELLPDAECCSENELALLPNDLAAEELAEFVVARMETGVSQHLQLKKRSETSVSGWALSQFLQHRAFEDGTSQHDVTWIIEGAASQSVEIRLPTGWWVESAAINGERIDAKVSNPARVLFDLPADRNTTLHLRCASRRLRSSWLSFERLEQPEISLPVLDKQELLWIPPARIPIRAIKYTAFQSRLADRLLPSSWWQWLAPAGPRVVDPDLGNWTVVEIGDEERPELAASPDGGSTTAGLWTIDRTAFSAMSLAAVLGISVGFWLFLGSSPRTWWLVISLAAVILVLIPIRWVPVVQLVCLSLTVTALMRLFAVVARIRGSGPKSSRGGSAVIGSVSTINTTVLLLALTTCADAKAQRPAVPPTPAQDSSEQPEIFGVLIPVNEAGEVSGAYAYAPTRLLDLLSMPGESTVRPTQPRVLSADYTLRTRRSTLNQPDSMQELSVELRIRVNQGDTEIRLPFNMSELSLARGNAAGQELSIGGRNLFQVADAVVYRASMAGTVRLMLQFTVLKLTQLEGESILQCGIPPIPTATLRIVSEGSTAFEVRSIGGSPKTVATSVTELLGPVNQLDVRWSSSTLRSVANAAPAEVFADTWLHARGPQMLSVCQLRVINGRSLPRELHLVVEPGWEPVGTDWGDGELIANELSSLAGRRIYTVRCGENWNERPQLTFRVLMIPRFADGSSTMTAPFFSLQEVSQQVVTRTLAWSTEGNATWKPDGLDFWPEIAPTQAIDWGSLQLQSAPKLYRVPLGSMATTLRRVGAQTANRVDEITQVHLGIGEARIQYRAQCQLPDNRAIALEIPFASRVDSVLLDGVVPQYRVSQRGARSVLEILPSDTPTAYEVVELEVSQPLTVSRESHLPRIVIRGFEANSSIYRVLRSAGLQIELESRGELSLESVNARPTELLSNLESLVGQTDLRNQYRESAQLPIGFSVTREVGLPPVSAVLYLDRTEQGWLAKLSSWFESGDEPLDFVFFELPVSVRESVDAGQLPARFIPMGDPERMTLCLIPSPPEAGRTRVDFSFLVPAVASSQSVAVPNVAVLSNVPMRPTLALPVQVDGEPVRWIRSGRKLDDSWQSPMDADPSDNYQYFELEKSQSLVSWKPLESNQRRTKLLASQLQVLASDRSRVSGSIDYWLQPGGQASVAINLPKQCKLLGVEIGGRPAIWEREAQQLSVLLQPNYLPVNIRLLMDWNSTSEDARQLSLPILPDCLVSGPLTVTNRLSEFSVDPRQFRLSDDGPSAQLARLWAELLIDSLPVLSGQSLQEIENWLEYWHPVSLGLEGSELIDSPRVSAMLRSSSGESTSERLDSAAVWATICNQAGLTATQMDAIHAQTQPVQRSDDDSPEAGRFASLPNQQGVIDPIADSIQLVRVVETSTLSSRLVAAGLLATAALLILMLANRLRRSYVALLSNQPWIYWLQLAVISWLLLPVTWPGSVLLLTAIGMFLGQLFDSRRRQRLMPRT